MKRRLSQCVLLQGQLLRRSLGGFRTAKSLTVLLHGLFLKRTRWRYMTRDFLTVSYCSIIHSGGRSGHLGPETLSLCLIALTFTKADAVELYNQRLSHCVLLQYHFLRRTLKRYMTRDFLTVSHCSVIYSSGVCSSGSDLRCNS